MITCQHARQLFDRYLDDELSPSLQAELHAHRLHCSGCQNDLALMEACGDVIRLDAREPALSGSFTDRVMAARREQVASRSRHWRRMALFVGAPLAAAASIALVFLLSAPAAEKAPAPHKGVTAGTTVAAPQEFRENLMGITGKKLDPKAEAELENTPEIKALPFMDSFLASLVKGTRNTAEVARLSVEDLGLLIRYGFVNMNDRLVAEYREKYPDDPSAQSSAQRVINDLDVMDPVFLQPPAFPTQESAFPTQESSNPIEVHDEVPKAI